MKKTLVAIAAMAAVSGAMAEATLYGWVDQAFNQKTVTTGSADAKATFWNGAQGGGSAIGVKGGEDLGNGLKASFLMEINVNAQSGSNTQSDGTYGTTAAQNAQPFTNRQSYVGLSGDFGDFKVGYQYTPIFNAVAGIDPSGATAYPGYVFIGSVSKGNGFYYTTPAIAGITAVLGSHKGGTADSSDSNTTSYGLNYGAGAFSAAYQVEKTMGVASLIAPTTTSAGAANARTMQAATGGQSSNYTTVTASYDLGMAKVSLANQTLKNSAATSGKASMTDMAVVIPMGSWTLGAISGTGSYTTSSTASSVNLSSMGLTADYALSKRTKIYVRSGSVTDNASTVVKNSTNLVGVFHTF